MAVTATELFDEATHTSDEKGIETATRVWELVNSDNEAPTFAAMLTAAGVTRYQVHPQKDLLIARNSDLKSNGSRSQWRLTWTYSNAPLELTGDFPVDSSAGVAPSATENNGADATGRLPVISFSRREYMKVLDKDARFGHNIVNTNDEPFDPPIEVPRSNMNVNINYKSVLVTPAHIFSYLDTVNDAVWNGFPAETLRVADFSLKTVYETYQPSGATEPAILRMSDVTIVLEYKAEGWQLEVLNRGRRESKTAYTYDPSTGSPTGSTTVLVAITDDSGQPVQEPVPLKLDGSRAVSDADFHYIDVNAFEQSDFTGLLI